MTAKIPTARLDKLLANLGYGSRREVQALIEGGRVILDGEAETDPAQRIYVKPDLVSRMTVAGAPLDPPPGLVLMLNKPLGVTCSQKDAGPLIYGLLPERWRRRDPALSTVGRLDKETSGLILLTDDALCCTGSSRPRAMCRSAIMSISPGRFRVARARRSHRGH